MIERGAQKLNRERQQKPIICISSHVVRGTVGNRACVLALEALGHSVWALQTVTMPWHPGHGPSTRIVADDDEFDRVIDDLCNAPFLSEVGGILTGYLGSASQATSISKLVQRAKSLNSDVIYLCDPVIGDHGGLYVPQDRAHAICDQLLPLADIITPNRFELSWICGKELRDNNNIIEASHELGRKRTLVTSSFSSDKNLTANLLITPQTCLIAEHEKFDAPINGMGDLTAALFLAQTMVGENDEACLQNVSSSVCEILKNTLDAGSNELALEQNLACLTNSKFPVRVSGYKTRFG